MIYSEICVFFMPNVRVSKFLWVFLMKNAFKSFNFIYENSDYNQYETYTKKHVVNQKLYPIPTRLNAKQTPTLIGRERESIDI